MINSKNISAFIIFVVMVNGFISINMIQKNKKNYNSLIKIIREENELLKNQVNEFQNNGMLVTVTMYHPVKYQTDSTPNILADGTRIRSKNASDYKFIAVSRNLLKRFGGWLDYGDFVLLRGTVIKDGIYQVRDTMNKRWVNRIDILETPGTKPYKFDTGEIIKTDLILKNNT